MLRALEPNRLRTAITAKPLSQRIVNIAMVSSVDRQGETRLRPWIATLSQLGWRDTVSVQNMIYVAAVNGDIAAVLDLSDALLRRRQMIDQMIPVLSVAETDPQARAAFVDRLIARPAWRNTYLTSTGHLQTAEQLRARYQILRELRRRGSPPSWSEAAQNIRALEYAGLYDLGFALWRSARPGVSRPLNDTHFLQASESFRLGEDPVPYQWQIPVGAGFSADAVSENGRSTLEINWNGRGVPMFAQQRTSAEPGRYVLEVNVSPTDVADLRAINFRFVCTRTNTAIAFQRDMREPTRFVTEQALPCAYPVLQIAGSIQAGATPHQLSLQSVTLRKAVPA